MPTGDPSTATKIAVAPATLSLSVEAHGRAVGAGRTVELLIDGEVPVPDAEVGQSSTAVCRLSIRTIERSPRSFRARDSRGARPWRDHVVLV